jgi:hypothetical protein
MTIQEEFSTQPPFQSEIKKVSGVPDGELAAPRGTIVASADGRIYVKRSNDQEVYGWQLLLPVMVFSTVADLLAYEFYTHNDVAIVLGETVPFDQGEGAGLFVFRSDDLSADDQGADFDHIRPDNIASDLLPGRWMCFEQASA